MTHRAVESSSQSKIEASSRRVLFVAPHHATMYSGGRYHAWIMAEAIAAGGADVIVWTTERLVRRTVTGMMPGGHLEKPTLFGRMGTILGLSAGEVAGCFAGVGGFELFWPGAAGFWPLSGRTSGFEPDQALHVVDQIGHANLGSGPRDADGADEQGH